MKASWTIEGVVVEARELTSQKNATWRGYVCKVATLGLTAELSITAELFKKLAGGIAGMFAGHFEDGNNGLRLVCTAFTPNK